MANVSYDGELQDRISRRSKESNMPNQKHDRADEVGIPDRAKPAPALATESGSPHSRGGGDKVQTREPRHVIQNELRYQGRPW